VWFSERFKTMLTYLLLVRGRGGGIALHSLVKALVPQLHSSLVRGTKKNGHYSLFVVRRGPISKTRIDKKEVRDSWGSLYSGL